MIRVLVSACLLGERVRYDGRDARCAHAILERWLAEQRLVPVCPELAGGLPVPRLPAEIAGGDGAAVLRREAQVLDRAGADVTAAFLAGAERALAAAKRGGARLAVLTARSPSCGSAAIHDGTFGGRLVQGVGVTTALLEAHGIRVFDQHRLAQAARHLAALEGARG